MEEWIYQLFSKGFRINRATILDIYNFDIKDIQCYNIFITKTTGLTLEQILGLKSWNKIKLVSENKWPSFYNFFIKNIKSGVMNIFIFLIEKKLEVLVEFFLIMKQKIGLKILNL